MKKILRSVIDIGEELSQDSLIRNYIYLSSSSLSLASAEDREIWNYIQNYAVNYAACPTKETIADFLERYGELSSLDRLDEITSVRQSYKNSDFENLVDQEVKTQKDQEMHVVLKGAAQILTQGMSIKEGREIIEYQGHRGAMQYIMKNADYILASERGFKTKTNIVLDTEEVREEFDRTCSGKNQNWGIVTGLTDIDTICRGIKKGELWTHAAFTSELKCLGKTSLLFNHATKRLECVEDLYARGAAPVVTALKKEGADGPDLVTAQASPLVENGVRPVYRVTLGSGRELEITDNHPLWTSKRGGTWRELKEIEVGDYVGLPAVMRVPEPREDFSDSEVKAIGYLLGAVSQSAGNGNSDMTSPLRSRLEDLELWGTDSGTKHIPGELFGLPDRQIALLLGALWSTDGSCHTGDYEVEGQKMLKRNDITYGTTSKELATGIQGLLTRLGINSTVRPVDTTYKGEPYRFYAVRIITNPSKKRFCDLIRVVGKEDQFTVLRDRLRDADDRAFPTDLISHLDALARTKSHTGSWGYAGQAQKRPTITGDGLRIFAQLDPELEKHLEGDVSWDRVESIEYLGDQMTYDLSVPEHHSFVVNDVITHNTTMAINWAYKAVFLQQYNVYYLSLEMSIEQLRKMVYVMHANHPKFKGQGWPKITYRLIRDGEDEEGRPITEHQKEFFHHIIDDVEENRGKNYGSFIIRSPDEDTTVPKLRADLEITHQQTPIHMAVVDHFALMKPEKSTRNYYTDLNGIIRDAKRMALSFNNGEGLPLLGLLQINRQGKDDATKNDGIYKMQALADANEAERSSDIITTTYLNQDLRATGSTKVGCLKNRDNKQFNPFVANIDWDTRYIFNVTSYTSDNLAMGSLSRDEMEALAVESESS